MKNMNKDEAIFETCAALEVIVRMARRDKSPRCERIKEVAELALSRINKLLK